MIYNLNQIFFSPTKKISANPRVIHGLKLTKDIICKGVNNNIFARLQGIKELGPGLITHQNPLPPNLIPHVMSDPTLRLQINLPQT